MILDGDEPTSDELKELVEILNRDGHITELIRAEVKKAINVHARGEHPWPLP